MQPRAEKLARPPTSTVEKTIVVKSPVVEKPVVEVVPVEVPPSRVDRIKEVVEAKKPSIPLEHVDAASKIFTF